MFNRMTFFILSRIDKSYFMIHNNDSNEFVESDVSDHVLKFVKQWKNQIRNHVWLSNNKIRDALATSFENNHSK